jgi:hypothetical protein
MKTLRCTCGQALSGETGAELYAAVEAHLTVHAAQPPETPRDGPRRPPEPEPKEQQ